MHNISGWLGAGVNQAEHNGLLEVLDDRVGSWGSEDRDPRGWATTHAYLALIPDTGTLTAGANAVGAAW